MGESKIPLYAFVDETGNTGHNLFDEVQPNFYTAALVTKGDFDKAFKDQVLALAKKFDQTALHGKDLGMHRIESVSSDFLKILKLSKATFFVSRVEKKYLLASKMFDCLLDSGENAGIAWHHYNIRSLRLMLNFKMAVLLDEDIAKDFWQCILEPKEEKIYLKIPSICERLIGNMDRLPDKRSIEVLTGGLEFAKNNPDCVQFHTDRKVSRQGHFPNLVAFANLLDGLERLSNERRLPVARITHDDQSEFKKTLTMWHELFSNASPDTLSWAGEQYKLQKVVGSIFEVKKDNLSPGIQVADVVLWLYSQFRKGKDLSPGCSEIIEYVLNNGWENDFSFEGVEREYLATMGPKFNEPITEEMAAAGKEFLEKAELARVASMKQYEQDRIPPFARTKPVMIE